MKKRWPIIGLVLALGVSVLAWKHEPLIIAWMALNTDKSSLDHRIELIEGGIELRLPDTGTAPFPVVLQIHGCAGIRPPFQEQWADIANRAGFAAMIVDSNGPRGFSRDDGLEKVCSGKTLIGHERAGDVLAAIKIAQNDKRLDTSRLVLTGWSHGGWSIMDFLTMDGKNRVPAGLSGWSDGPIDITGTVLFYPYCGAGALSRFREWVHQPKTLVFVAGADKMVPATACISYFEKRQSKGDPVDLFIYDEADHVFDDPFLEPEWIHWYNEEYFKDAVQRYETFLGALK